ncbi:DNA polymerase III subunit alpha [compost metagenome]
MRAKSADGEVRFFGDDASQMETLLDDTQIGLRVVLSAQSADAEALKARLDRARSQGKGGEVWLQATLGGRTEVEIKLPGRYRLDAALRGALKSAPGVIILEDA